MTVQVRNLLDAATGLNILIPIIIFVILYSVLLNYFIAKDLMVRFEFCEQCLTYGTFGWGEIRYDKVDSIYFDKDIILVLNSKKKKIRVFNLDENKDMYLEMLAEIKDKVKLDFSLDEAIKIL